MNTQATPPIAVATMTNSASVCIFIAVDPSLAPASPATSAASSAAASRFSSP